MASKSIDELLEKYKFTELEIVSVGDFKIKTSPFYFKVIFKYTDSNGKNWYPVAEAPPEELHKRYKVGSRFFKKSQIGYGDDVFIASYEIDNRVLPKIHKIRDVLFDTDKKVITDEKMEEYFLKQNCYYIQYEEYDLIIPHYTIANHFHFKSSALKDSILNNTFNSLYFPNSFKRIDENKVELRIKSKANQSDLKIICNFLEDRYSFESFKYYLGQRAKLLRKQELVEIEALFPYQDIFNIKTLSKQINTVGKPKILVLGIYQDDYKYSFNQINYFIDKSIDINGIEVGKPKFSKEKPSFNRGSIINKPPSSRYITQKRVFVESYFGDLDEIELNPIFTGENTNKPIIPKTVDKSVDGSFEGAVNCGDENLQQTKSSAISQGGNKTESELFNIEDFKTLFNSLKNHKDISSAYISECIELVPKENDKGKIPARYYTEQGVLRKYIYGSFKFKGFNVGFLELEHSKSWTNISTWFFIFKNEYNNVDINFANNIVANYLTTTNTLKVIEKSLELKNIVFFGKTHLSDITKEKEVFDWIKRLLIVIVSKI
jgi:hypothetical protein